MTRFEKAFVWLGGAMFVASLAAGAFTYLFRWARPGRSGTSAAIAINALLFGVFALHHSLFARQSVKSRVERVVAERLLRSVYVWIASLLFAIVLAAWRPIGIDIYQTSGAVAVALTTIQLSGIWLIARAVGTIDPLELAGIRTPSAKDTLQIRGPYRFVRHPVYLGWIFAVFGASHMTGDRLTFAAISTAYLILAIPWEERSLLRTFGDEYARYTHQVRWRVVPYLY